MSPIPAHKYFDGDLHNKLVFINACLGGFSKKNGCLKTPSLVYIIETQVTGEQLLAIVGNVKTGLFIFTARHFVVSSALPPPTAKR